MTRRPSSTISGPWAPLTVRVDRQQARLLDGLSLASMLSQNFMAADVDSAPRPQGSRNATFSQCWTFGQRTDVQTVSRET